MWYFSHIPFVLERILDNTFTGSLTFYPKKTESTKGFLESISTNTLANDALPYGLSQIEVVILQRFFFFFYKKVKYIK